MEKNDIQIPNENNNVDPIEKERQEKLLKSVKSKEQIQQEIAQKMNSQIQNTAVATALMSTIPVKKNDHEKQTQPIEVRRFEITLYEEDEAPDGSLIKKIVNGGKPEYIEAESPIDLQQKLSLYKACGQFPQVKEVGPTKFLDPITRNEISKEQAQLAIQVQTNGNAQAVQQQLSKNDTPIKRPIKYYKIGGIDIKDDNGKIYQKQWVRLSDDESKNVRIINDKNNAIFNLNGKHIEMMKWTLVENDDNSEMESDINE